MSRSKTTSRRAGSAPSGGSNYARLLFIKCKDDPTGLFFAHHGVGSELTGAPDGMMRVAS